MHFSAGKKVEGVNFFFLLSFDSQEFFLPNNQNIDGDKIHKVHKYAPVSIPINILKKIDIPCKGIYFYIHLSFAYVNVVDEWESCWSLNSVQMLSTICETSGITKALFDIHMGCYLTYQIGRAKELQTLVLSSWE